MGAGGNFGPLTDDLLGATSDFQTMCEKHSTSNVGERHDAVMSFFLPSSAGMDVLTQQNVCASELILANKLFCFNYIPLWNLKEAQTHSSTQPMPD